MKKQWKILWGMILIACGWPAGQALAVDLPSERPTGLNDSGVQLSRTRQYLEWQRIRQRIAEGREQSAVEGPDQEETGSEGNTVRFVLKAVTADPSAILTEKEIQDAAAPYLDKEISLEDIYRIISALNALYSEKGYMTCRAYLAP